MNKGRKPSFEESLRLVARQQPQRFTVTRLPGQRSWQPKRQAMMATKDDDKPRFSTVRARDLMRIEFPARKWAVQGLIPEGLTVLAGGKSVGKSWFALNVSLAIAEGKPALGKIPTKQGTVLYLSLEDDNRLVQERLTFMGVDPVPGDFHLAFAADVIGPVLRAKLMTWFDDEPNTRLVVIDLLAKVRPPSKRQANNYQDEYEMADTLTKVANAASVPIILLTHTNQRGEEQLNDTFDGVSGTTGLLAPAAAVMKLSRKRHEQTLLLEVSGKSVKEHKYTIARDEQWRMVLTDEPPKPAMSPQRQEIMDFLLRHCTRGYTPAEVAKELGKEGPAIRKLMREMHRDDQLRQDEKAGYWGLV